MASKSDASGFGSLEPAAVWGFFSMIAAIPHPSRKEERIRQGVRAMAQEHGLSVREDSTGNVVIDVPGSPGCGNAPITVLQAHLDMVCEKNSDSAHDFDRDGVSLIIDHDAASGKQIVRADGTTLGADNGIGVAMALAAASETEVIHGPLELVFTVDEESGMTGAKALRPDSFRGRRMLNLDSEEDDVLYIGCAGGCDTTLSFECGLERPGGDAVACRVAVAGLRGGHSGSDIHENRGNAIKVLARTLLRADAHTLQVASISGGQLRNAIPREAEAVVSGSPETIDALRAAGRVVADEVIRESAEEQLSISVQPVPVGDVPAVLPVEQSSRILATLAALPHGVLGMHPGIEGLVETSNNLATVIGSFVDGQRKMHVEIGTLSRSSSGSRKQATVGQIAAVGKLAGALVRTSGDYPGWEPNMDSPALSTCRRAYTRLFDEEPKVTATHAGLECGIIGERVGGLDMVSLGPTIERAHTPEERIYVASVQKSWKYLLAILAEFARG
ncbi:MAG: beta-Ala-His dipeptidase [Phycisphaerales bacterium]|nr:MAG: beta-Ala-His dipeptidase [Phycisphaerales bacterium]